MGHSVRLVIGKDPAVGRLLKRWPGSCSVPLRGGWKAIPIEDDLYETIQFAAAGVQAPEELSPELQVSPSGLQAALIAATKQGGGLAYIETDYWGGSGGQSAMSVVDGRIASGPSRSQGAGGPINSALRAIGVAKAVEMGEFDTIGLGERRSMSDYQPEGRVQLRQPGPKIVAEPPTGRHLPLWLALVMIAGFIAFGFALYQLF